MKPSRYTQFCNHLFGSSFSRYNKDQIRKKTIALAQANIAMDFDAYYSMALMNSLIGLIVSLMLAGTLYILYPSLYTMVLIILGPAMTALSIGAAYWYYPTYCRKKRGRNIDLFLPYAVNFISSMAVAGISPAEIFQSLSAINMYGEIQKEAKKIAKEITIMGSDSITAIKHAIEVSPSKKFRAFLQGIVGTIQSGSDLHSYLTITADRYMNDDLVERKKDLDLLSVIAEIFVMTAIAFPIFLVIILSVMGFFGGSMSLSMMILILFSFAILPLVYLGFYLLVKSTSIEEINKIHPVKHATMKQYYRENKTSLHIVLLSAGILALFLIILHGLTYFNYLSSSIYLYVDSAFLGVLLIIGPLGIYNYLQVKKKKHIQERLPEFLVEIGDSLSTGMTIFEAIKAAEKGHYGELGPNINKMKTQLSWNVSIKDAFNDFATKMKSAIIQRIVITINRGIMMGGSTPKVFKAAAREVSQINQLEDQRKQSMSIYTIVIVLCFFVFLAIIVILDKTIFTSFLDIQTTQLPQINNGLMMSSVNPTELRYSLFSFVFVQSIGAGVLAGFMTDGKLASGIRYSCVLGLISFFTFKCLF